MKLAFQRKPKHCQGGFSLIELMISVAILLTVTAVVVSSISQLQRRSTNENAKLDSTQETREFIDQISRDIHQIGYPNTRMNATIAPGAPAAAAPNIAVPGVTETPPASATPNQIQFEGDLDGSGTVQEVFLQFITGPGGSCPCTLQRGTETKAQFIASGGGLPPFFTQLNNVINSGAQFAIAGNDNKGNNYDNLYASYKAAPVFQLLDNLGNNASGSTVKTVTVTVNVLSPRTDQETGEPSVVTMTTTSRLNN